MPPLHFLRKVQVITSPALFPQTVGQMVLLGECRGVHFTFVSGLSECVSWFPWSSLLAVLGCRFTLSECVCGLLVSFVGCAGSPILSECVSQLFMSVVSLLLV